MAGTAVGAAMAGGFAIAVALIGLVPWASDRRAKRFLDSRQSIDVARDVVAKQGEICRDIQQAVRSAYRRAREMTNYIDGLGPKPSPGPDPARLLQSAVGGRDLELVPELDEVRVILRQFEASSDEFGREYYRMTMRKKASRSSIQLQNLIAEMIQAEERIVAAKDAGLAAVRGRGGVGATRRRRQRRNAGRSR